MFSPFYIYIPDDLELVFVYGMKQASRFIYFFHMDILLF